MKPMLSMKPMKSMQGGKAEPMPGGEAEPMQGGRTEPMQPMKLLVMCVIAFGGCLLPAI